MLRRTLDVTRSTRQEGTLPPTPPDAAKSPCLQGPATFRSRTRPGPAAEVSRPVDPHHGLTRFNRMTKVSGDTAADDSGAHRLGADETGRSAPPGRTVGIKQVAAHAGVSPGTVSNVLNRP